MGEASVNENVNLNREAPRHVYQRTGNDRVYQIKPPAIK